MEPAVDGECVLPAASMASVGKIPARSRLTPKMPSRTVPTREPHEPLVASRTPRLRARAPSPRVKNATVWT
jgi:hypothetical protein